MKITSIVATDHMPRAALKHRIISFTHIEIDVATDHMPRAALKLGKRLHVSDMVSAVATDHMPRAALKPYLCHSYWQEKLLLQPTTCRVRH